MKKTKEVLESIYHKTLVYIEDYYLTEIAFMLVITTYLVTSIGGGVIFWVIVAIWGHFLIQKHQLGYADIFIYIILYAVLFFSIGYIFNILLSHNILLKR